MGIVVLEEYCPKNHYCPVVKACPYNAIFQKHAYIAPDIDIQKCTSCGICTKQCPAFRIL